MKSDREKEINTEIASLSSHSASLKDALLQLLSSPNLASKRWIWEQYDHQVGNDTIQKPGGDAAVVRVRMRDGTPTHKALAMTTDCTPRYCYSDPIEGGKQAVAETWRNLTAVGATPLAITNCLNFGNPEKPEIMGQIVGCLQGMREACLALDYPVISGNVSLYNETNGKGIHPTPAIGGVGVLKDISKHVTAAFTDVGHLIFLVGKTRGHLPCSLYQSVILNEESGPPPPVDLQVERRNGDWLRAQPLATCHDLADGGLLVALAEMCIAGNTGAAITLPEIYQNPAFAFGEDQGRYVIAVLPAQAEAVKASALKAGVPLLQIGETQEKTLSVQDAFSLNVTQLRAAHERWLPEFMHV